MKIRVIWDMKGFSRISKRLLVLFILAIFLVIPFVDSIACDECVGIAPFQGGIIEVGQLNAPQIEMPLSLHDTDANNKTASKDTVKNICPICFNTIGGVSSNHFKNLFSAIPFANQTIFTAFLEPAFSINKPPQN